MIASYKQAGQKGVEHVTLRQARGVSDEFPEIIFSVFNSLAFTQPRGTGAGILYVWGGQHFFPIFVFLPGTACY